MIHRNHIKKIIYTVIGMASFVLADSEALADAESRQETITSDDSAMLLNNPETDPAKNPNQLFLHHLNQHLDPYGVQFGLGWVNEVAGVVSGGKNRGATYAHQIAFSLDLDWEKIAGLKGLSTHMMMFNFAGRSASKHYVGDPHIQAQDVYIPHQAMLRMYNFYFEQQLWDNKVNIKVGRQSTGNDFGYSVLSCQFMMLSSCGHPRSIAQQGFSTWPGTVWGARILYQPTSEFYVQVGAYQSNPWPQGGKNGWDWGGKHTTGAFLPIEFGYHSDIGKDHLIGHLHVGAGFDTSRFKTWSAQATGSGKTDHRSEFWVMMDQMIYRNDPVENHGLYVIGNWGHDSPTTATYKDFYNLGFLNRGFWHDRPNDQMGVMFSYYTVPRGLSRAQSYQIAQGNAPMHHGVLDLLNEATGIQSNAMMFELNYGISAYRGIMVMPVFEYFHHVGATRSSYNDAVVLGMRTSIIF